MQWIALHTTQPHPMHMGPRGGVLGQVKDGDVRTGNLKTRPPTNDFLLARALLHFFFKNKKGPQIPLILSTHYPVELFEKYQELDLLDLFKVSRCGPAKVIKIKEWLT